MVGGPSWRQNRWPAWHGGCGHNQARFLNPVFVGDTLYCTLTVSNLKPGNTTGVITLGTEVKNQKGVVVMDGFQKYLLRKRHPGQ